MNKTFFTVDRTIMAELPDLIFETIDNVPELKELWIKRTSASDREILMFYVAYLLGRRHYSELINSYGV